MQTFNYKFDNESGLKRFKRADDSANDLKESTSFVSKTSSGDYKKWLTQADIANIARTAYGWYGEDNNVVFEVIGSVDQLGIQLERHKNKLMEPNKQSLTFIVNLGGNHWVTLVVAYQGQQFSAYYIDSLASGIQNNIRDKLSEKITGINIQSFNIQQQNDGYNCGIFALENARIINNALQSAQQGQIEQRLSNYEPTEEQLRNKRIEFAEKLRERGVDISGSRPVNAINRKNTNEVSQDFELIQLLIQEADSVEGADAGTSTQQRKNLESFQARFQSYIDQIPSYLHSVGKPGFFPHFFLGSFSTLLDTEVARKLDINKIYFDFNGAKTLKVAVIKNGEINSQKDVVDKVKLFVISESGSRPYTQEFDQGELKEVLGGHYSLVEDNPGEIKVKLVEINKDNINDQGISFTVEDRKVDTDRTSGHQFTEIKKGLWNKPEDDIAKLAGAEREIVERNLKKVLEEISKVHSKYEDSLEYASRAREAAHHGFIAGVLNNFRYRYNLRVYLEQFGGRGYTDIVLLARGPDRALNSVPIIIELKAGSGPNLTPNKALEQTEKYAQGFQPNVQRVLTTADDILCVGVNLDNSSPISNIEAVSRKERIIPLFEDMLKSTDDWDTQEIGKRKLKKQIKDNLERIYHTFPGTPEKGDNHYFSRFLLGQSLLLDEVKDLETKFEKHIFIYYKDENIPTEIHPDTGRPQRPAAQKAKGKLSTGLDSSHAVVSMVLIPESTEKLVYVINIVEANRKDVLDKVLPLDKLSKKIGNREIVKLNLNFDTRYKLNFERYLTVEADGPVSLEQYNQRGVGKFQGSFREVPYPPYPGQLKKTFDRALDSQRTQSSSIDEYNKLLKKIGEGIWPFKILIGKENDFQGVLNGAFSYYSDLKLQESPETKALVLTEFQTGRGERIDMLVHGIKFEGNAREYTPIGLELKISRQGKGAEALLKKAEGQINEEYKKGVTYKTLTDGDKVEFIGVVFNKGAKNADSLILTSEESILVKVVHSSTHVLSQVENLRTLESATSEKDYQYWLQQHDIADIARIEYGYGTDTLFEVVGSQEHIANQLQRFRYDVTTRGEERPLTLIVNLDNNHWVTLVIAYQNGQYNGYYVDSLGGNIPDNIRQVLQQGQITVHDVSVAQQTDGHNCGLWVLENARDINAVLQEDRLHGIPIDDEIRSRLQVRERNEDYFVRIRKNVSRKLDEDQQRKTNLKNILAGTHQPVGQCSKERKKRNIGMACVDSRDEEDITKEEKEQRIKELFNADKVAEKVKNIEFYDQLFKVSQKISEGEVIDKNVEEAFVAKIKDVDLDSIDPEIRDIVKEMKDNIENKEEVKNILRRSGVAEKIGKVAEGAGLAFTVFLVGKHIANGDIEGLGYDALNLWIMPKIGEKISGKMLELGTKLDSQMLRGFAPVMGRAIGNFAAFLGLAESIKARQSATDPVDIKIAGLNIATNSIFIAADVPAVVTETMSAIGMEAGVVGEFTGPVGFGISVAVIIISQFVEAGLEVEKLGEHIKLTDQEKHDLYWDFFLDKKVPDYIGNDLQAEEIYKQYISKILDQFKGSYDKIAISLPSILLTEEKYLDGSIFRRKREVMQSDDASAYLGITPCFRHTRIVDNKFDFRLITRVSDISLNVKSGNNHISRLLPSTMKNYSAICGPKGDDVDLTVISEKNLQRVEGVAQCGYRSEYENIVLSTTVKKVSLKEYLPGCQNAILYSKSSSSRLPANMLFYIPNNDAFINVTSNYTIDVIFNGKNILLNSYGIDNQGSSVQNRYYFTDQLSNCNIHKQGTNFFYIAKDNFVCNLGGSSTGQNNIVVTRGNFADSENIHSVIGSSKANHIEVSYAGYVDGKGGNDVITAKNFTTIKGYFGDSIHGKGLVLLPINFNDIYNITHVNNITTIYNKRGAFISVDKQTSVKTADGLFVTPTKIDDKTGVVTNLHVIKSLSGDIVLDDELDNLRKIDNSNFNITKQLSSANYHSTIGSSSNHIFYPDKEHHNFYWEAPSNISHLYLFDNRNVNITIAQANGILDFSQLNCTLDDIPFIENKKGEIKINKNGLNVTLLPDYKDVTVTFDGQEYYKLQDGELERDYCSHSLKIDGRFSVNGTELLNHHNCFTFDSEKVLFLKLNNNLLLLSDRGALSISDYYSSVHKNWDLSIELSDKIMEPEEFGERADEFSSFRYYQPDEQGLQIYHNQPVNKNDIGLVDLKDKSILDFNMRVMNDTLLLSHKNNTLVKVENWNTYQPAREMMFVFNDAIVSNSRCIVSTCNSEDVMVEFNKEKIILQIFDAVKQNNIDAKDKDGKTLFHIVAKEGDLGSAMLLVDKIESINFERSLYAEPDELVRAIRQRERLKSLINEKDKFGYTPLQYAAKHGKWDIVNLFLDKTAERGPDDVADRNTFSTSWTTVHYAVYNGDLNLIEGIFQFLSDKDVIINTTDSSDWTPLHYAVFYDVSDIVKFLVDEGASIEIEDIEGKTPLDVANEYGYFETLRLLINKAIEKDKLGLVTSFLDKTAKARGIGVYDPDSWKHDWKIIHYAVYYGNLDIVRDILKFPPEKVGDVHSVSDGWVAIHYAVYYNRKDIISFLIDQGSSTEVQAVYGQRTPLHIAVEQGRSDIFALLISKGAKIDAIDTSKNQTPIQKAREKGRSDMVKLLEYIVSLNGTPLHYYAAQEGKLELVKFLLNNGANIEAKDVNGSTPLLYAVQENRLDVVKFLVGRGANINARNNFDQTPLEPGRSDVSQEIINFLREEQDKRPVRRKRRHNHGDHNRNHNHSSYKFLSIGSSNQPELAARQDVSKNSLQNDEAGYNGGGATSEPSALIEGVASEEYSENIASSATRVFNPINNVFNWAKNSIEGVSRVTTNAYLATKGVVVELFGSVNRLAGSISDRILGVEETATVNEKTIESNEEATEYKLEFRKDIPNSTSSTLFNNTDQKQTDNGFYDFIKYLFWDSSIEYMDKNLKQARERQMPDTFKLNGKETTAETISKMGEHLLSQASDGTIMLLELFIRQFNGRKRISTADQSISELEAMCCALSITDLFKKALEQQAKLKDGIQMHRLNIDFGEIQEVVTGKVMGSKFNEIPEILKSHVEKALPSRKTGDPGRLSTKKFDKFMTEFNSIIDPVINQSMQQMLGRLEASNVKEQQISLEPKSYLNDISVQGHLTQDRGLRNQGRDLIS